jgi:hypothetical protein
MGSDAAVFVFDYDAYMHEVAPAFRQLLLTGQVPKWLYPAIKRREIKLQRGQATDILRYCTYFDKDFSWVGSYDDKDNYDLEWKRRACKSEVCPEQDHCPFHLSQSQERAEELLWLFEAAVSIKCLGSSQFVGRSMVVTNYWETLTKMMIHQSDALLKLLVLLGKRGFVIGYQWGFGYEGINGWLDPQETTELALRLRDLPLPRYEETFMTMQSFNHPHPNTELHERFGLTAYDCPGFSFQELSLSFVRIVATIAAKESKGILWGNDVMWSDYYLNDPHAEAST